MVGTLVGRTDYPYRKDLIMGRFTLTIATDNDAFTPEPNSEIARILRRAAYRIENGWLDDQPFALLDANGSSVGSFAHTASERKHVWQRARFTGTRTCERCGLLPLDSDDDDSPCTVSE
jgi:hypothetical protein